MDFELRLFIIFFIRNGFTWQIVRTEPLLCLYNPYHKKKKQSMINKINQHALKQEENDNKRINQYLF